MMKRAALYFIAGAVMDGLICGYYLAVDDRALFPASILSVIITFFSILVIGGFLDRTDERREKMALLWSYAIGNGVGTAAARTPPFRLNKSF